MAIRKEISMLVRVMLAGVVILMFSLLVAANTALEDRLAADAESANYRTHLEDDKITQIPQDINEGIFKDPKKYLPLLVDFLTEDAADDYAKIKRVHDWLTHNIAYDSDAYYAQTKEKKDTYSVILDKRTTCGGFAIVFKDMAVLAGMDALIIHGTSRKEFNIAKNRMAAHVWNAVKINSKWYIVDATADHRMDYKKSSFSPLSDYKDTELFISPEAKIMENFPAKEEYQFLKKPVDLETFLSKPFIEMRTLQYNVTFVTDIAGLIKKKTYPQPGGKIATLHDSILIAEEILAIVLDAPSYVSVYAKVMDSAQKFYEANAFCFREKSLATCQFTAPAAGEYDAYISARFKDRKGELAQKLYTFKLDSAAKGTGLPAPNFLFQVEPTEKYNVEITDYDKSAFSFIELKQPQDVDVFVGIYEKDIKESKLAAKPTVLSATDEEKHIRFEIPEYSKNEYLLKIKAKRKDESVYSDVIALVRIKKQ